MAVFVILWYIFGHSPTQDQLLLALVLPLYMYVFYTREKFNEKLYKTREELLKELSEIKTAIYKK